MRELLPLAVNYIKSFKKDQQKIRDFIQRDWVPLEILRLVYYTLTAEKEIEAIEQMNEGDKKRLKEVMKVWGTGDVEHKMKQARAIHLIEQLAEIKITL